MTDYLPGDILLVNDFSGPTDWLGGMIRDGALARGDGQPIWTHSALIVSADGDLVEALAQGVVRSPMRKYLGVPTRVVSLGIPADDPRRAYAVRYALAACGEPYGVVDFISLGFSLLLRNRWSTHVDGHPICSELVARATEACTEHGYPWAPERMMPSDLLRAFNGDPPLRPLGFLARLRILIVTTARAAVGVL